MTLQLTSFAQGRALLLFALLAPSTVACGKKGPPLPPLHLVPDAVVEPVAQRTGNEVRLRFTLPDKNLNGPGAVNMRRIEVLAVTVAAGAAPPTNREFLTDKYVVQSIEVRPAVPPEPPATGKPIPLEKPAEPVAVTGPAATMPGPGEPMSIVEVLDAEKLKPQFALSPEQALQKVSRDTAADALSTVAAALSGVNLAAAKPPAYPVRLYVIRGVAPDGRPGQPSVRLQVPLVDPPAAPTDVTLKFTETAIQLAWTPPAAAADAVAPDGYNVYTKDGVTPLNAAPLKTPAFERADIAFGKEECFVVRTVKNYAKVTLESAPSAAQCLTPQDIFPPAAPAGLSAVATTGAINLIWQANTDADLGGYLILRGEAPGDTLEPITPAPVTETTYRDTTVKAGVRYVYVIVAVDRATPPNRSGPSTRVEETAR